MMSYRAGYGTGEACERSSQAFLKKLAMLPCPFFAAGFTFELLDCLMGTGFGLG
jgi:hypothetical protein